MDQRLQACLDRVKSSQAQQVERCGPQSCHHSGTVTAVAVVFPELGVTDPVPARQTQALSYKSQQCFWGGSQAGDESVSGMEGLAVAGANSDHLRDPAGAVPVRLDVLWCFIWTQGPGDVTALANLMIHCSKSDMPLPEQLVGDLVVDAALIRVHGQQEVGPMLRKLLKDGLCV